MSFYEEEQDYEDLFACPLCQDSGEIVVGRHPGGEPICGPCPACTGPGA